MGKRLDIRLTASITSLLAASLLAVTLLLLSQARQTHLETVDAGLESTAWALAEGFAELWEGGQSPAAAIPVLQAHISRVGSRLPERLTVIDAAGRVLADTHRPPEEMANHRGRPEVEAALAGRTGVVTRYSETVGANMRYLAVPILSSGGTVVGVMRAAVPLSRLEQRQRDIGAVAVLVGLGALGFALLAAARLSRGVAEPLAEIGALAEDMAHGRFHRRIAVPQIQELATLTEALHAMGARLDGLVAELSREKTHLEGILNSMGDGVLVVDSQLRVTLTNRAAAQLLGPVLPPRPGPLQETAPGPLPFVGGPLSLKEAAGRPLGQVVPSPALVEAFAQTLRDGRPRHTELEWPPREEGAGPARQRVLHVATVPLWSASAPLLRNGVVGILRDITELRRLERVRRDFVANVSHELRTPLTVLQGFQETLLEGDVPPDRQRRFLEIMIHETNRMVSLVNDLLQLSELETAAKPLALEPVNLAALAEQVRDTFATALAEKDIQWVTDIPPHLPPVPADRRLLEQVLHNLVSNAVKYMGEKGGTVTVGARQEDGHVHLWVTDTGMGIPEEHLPRLFERFYRVDAARSRQQGGTGLGLSIVRHIIERHGGRVWAESRLGHGTTIRFTLPLIRPQPPVDSSDPRTRP